MHNSSEVKVLYPTWWRRRVELRARASSWGGIWRKRGAKPWPDGQKPDTRQDWPDEWANDHEVHIHQGPGL